MSTSSSYVRGYSMIPGYRLLYHTVAPTTPTVKIMTIRFNYMYTEEI